MANAFLQITTSGFYGDLTYACLRYFYDPFTLFEVVLQASTSGLSQLLMPAFGSEIQGVQIGRGAKVIFTTLNQTNVLL